MLLVEKPTYEVTLVDLVNPEHPVNVIGVGGWRGNAFSAETGFGGSALEQLKPLVVRVTDHADDMGGVQGTDPWENFAFFESKAAGQPWKKCTQTTHLIHSSDAGTDIFSFKFNTKRRKTYNAIKFRSTVVGETIGIQYHASTQITPILTPYVIASTDPVSEANAFQTLVDGSTASMLCELDPDDPTVVVFYSSEFGTISVDGGFIIPAVIAVPDDHDVYFPYYNYSHFE
jgi:hypothetical protein